MKLKVVYQYFAENLKKKIKIYKGVEKIFLSYRQYWCQVKNPEHIPFADTHALLYDSHEFNFHAESQPF
jgi:hypothetical protein